MPSRIDINTLGQRIAIIGPSNSGKSTLAETIGKALNLPVTHLDQLAHKAGTNWERIPDETWQPQHNAIINQSSWIIEGNYSFCMTPRFERAQTIIWLDFPLYGCLCRYFLRSFFGSKERAGGLDGARKEFSWGLVRYTLQMYPKNKIKYKKLIQDQPHLNVIIVKKFPAIPFDGKPHDHHP